MGNITLKSKLACLVAVASVTLVPASYAEPTLADQQLPQHTYLPLALATKMANSALEKCEEGGYRVSVAVVDEGGTLRVLVRGDGAGPHTIDSSTKKAYTALSLRRPTQEMAELLAKVPTIQALRDMNENILLLGGGFPIKVGGQVVGGIGVGGAPGAQLDEACAQAGLDQIGNGKPSEPNM